MNKGKSIIIIVVILILLGSAEQILFSIMLKSSQEQANQIQGMVENEFVIQNENLISQINSFSESWHKKEFFLCTFSINKEIEDVGILIVRLKNASQNIDYDDAKESIDLIVFYLSEYKKLVSVNLQNIF